MNEFKRANRQIQLFIESGLSLEDGISKIRYDLPRVFRFDDIARFSRQAMRGCYEEFEAWLNSLMLTEAPPEGVCALNFGLFTVSGVVNLYVSGSRSWKIDDPDWACDRFYLPDSSLQPALYQDISTVISEYNGTGLYLSITILAMMIREYTERGMISLLDIKRKVLYLACGYDEGDLYNVGRLTDQGLQAPKSRLSLFG